MFRKERTAEIIGLVEAFGAAIIWGFAFITLRWSVEPYGPLWVRALSFSMLALTMVPLGFFVRSGRRNLNWANFRRASLPGVALGLCLAFQAIGIRTTSVANNSFITVLNIVFIPFGEVIFFNVKPRKMHWLAVGLAMGGIALLCGGIPTQWSRGDIITLGCAIMGACHFLLLQRVAKDLESPFFFNLLQVCWAAIITLPAALIFEPVPIFFADAKAIWSLAFLAFASIMIGFMLQLRAQRTLSATVASLICLLEAPFASLFAFAVLGEVMHFSQLAGAAVILGAAVLAAFTPMLKD